ncbi:MAG: DUF4407 domain-containing protein [Bacteroidia bacterium]|nr:DUF4407 domain-containing protein [Bacteroidia bacterium]
MNKLRNFFWWCSGANKSILEKCPTEHEKYFGIGGTVFFTGLFAVISGSYALYFVFNDLYSMQRIISSILFGLIYGSMIFNLDRWIVSSMKKGKNRLAIIRLFLAAIIAFVISKPLELQIFHTSVEYEIENMKQKDIKYKEDALINPLKNDISELESQISNLNKEISEKAKVRDNLISEANGEWDASKGTHVFGNGPVFKKKQSDADRVQKELDEINARNLPLIDKLQKELIAKRDSVKSLSQSVKSKKRGNYDGLDKRINPKRIFKVNNYVILPEGY